MSLSQLKRTLQREFKRNPAKSITLLALLPVAGYFIGPVLWKQLPSGKKGEQVSSKPSFLAAAGAEVVAVPNDKPAAPGWQDLADWISLDVRMKSGTIATSRDPFHPIPESSPQVAEAGPAIAEQSPVAASLRPEDCGLELTATIVGPTRQLASISGRLYSRDARVKFGDFHSKSPDSQAERPDDAFVLKSIAKTHVVLERQGEQFLLTIRGGQDE
jgi:hypothetical protein